MTYWDIPVFLNVKSGNFVLIKDCKESIDHRIQENFWIGKVINCIGGARKSTSWTLFQVMNIDTGEISIINADTVEKIIKRKQIKSIK